MSRQPDIYHQFFELSLDLCCIAASNGFFQDINGAFCGALGYKKQTLLSQPYTNFIHPLDLIKTINELKQLDQLKKTVNFENRYRHADGHYLMLSWSAMKDLNSELVFATARDVTKERNSKNKSSQIEKALNNEAIVALTDDKGIITQVNDNFINVSGYSSDELKGNHHRVINSGTHSKMFFRELWKTISSGKTWSGLIENKNKNGEHYYVQSVITPIFDLNKNIINYLGISFDTTTHVNIKNQLHKTLHILNETGKIAKVGGWELNVKSGELTWTDETFNILEVVKGSNQKPTLPEGLVLFTEEHQPLIEMAVNRAISHGQSYELELQAKTKKGKVFWVLTTGQANYRDEKVVSLSGTIQDIDSRKKAEIELERQRALSIQNSKLASLGEMSAGIAHEINNPLTAIYASSQLMFRYVDNPSKLVSKLNDINKSCERISHIINGLKKFSRSDKKQHFSMCNLNRIVNETLVLTKSKTNRHNVHIIFEYTDSAPIFCCEVEIEQVLINLISNSIDAVKFDKEKWIKIKQASDDDSVTLKIIDSGKGISNEKLGNLFTPFYTTKPVGQGTGLGLSITKGILDTHNASIYVDTNMPNTCFTIVFKRYKEI
ncbi:PAS domain S-box protein [Colwelliaceae bacterium 6471]